MNEAMTVNEPAQAASGKGETRLIDILIVLAKRKKLIIGVPLTISILAGALSFALPNIYRASTKLLPPQQAQSGAAALLSQLGGAAGMVAGAAGIKTPNDLYIGMLGSRTIADRMIARFDLKKVYDIDSLEKVREHLKADTVISTGKDGLISIEVESKDKKLAAPLANAYVDELKKMTQVLAVTEAGQRRLFFEGQLELAKNNLATAEMSLKRALDTGGVISIDSDSRAMVETVGRLRAQISAKEIQLGSMQAFVTSSNPQYRHTQEELSSLRDQLSKLENGSPTGAARTGDGNSKPVGLENIKILRDVKYYQMLYELLAKQYEAARLDEAHDSAVIQVLDPAVEPERKYKPMRALIVLMAGLFGLFAGVGAAFVLEGRERAMHSPDEALLWQRLRQYAFGKAAR